MASNVVFEESASTRFVRFTIVLPSPGSGHFGEMVAHPEISEFSNGEKFIVTKTVTCFENGFLPIENRPIFGVNVLVPENELTKWRMAPTYLEAYSPDFRNYGSIIYPVTSKVNVTRDIVAKEAYVPINEIITREYDLLSNTVTGTLVTGHHLTFRPKTGKNNL